MLKFTNSFIVKLAGGQKGGEVTFPKPGFQKEAEESIFTILRGNEEIDCSTGSFLDGEGKKECRTIDDALEKDEFIRGVSVALALLAKRMTYDGIVLDDDLLKPENWGKILLTLRRKYTEGADLAYLKSKEQELKNFFNGFNNVGVKIKDKGGYGIIKSFGKKSPYTEEADKYMKLLWKIAGGNAVHEGGLFRNSKGELDAEKTIYNIKTLVEDNIKDPLYQDFYK